MYLYAHFLYHTLKLSKLFVDVQYIREMEKKGM